MGRQQLPRTRRCVLPPPTVTSLSPLHTARICRGRARRRFDRFVGCASKSADLPAWYVTRSRFWPVRVVIQDFACLYLMVSGAGITSGGKPEKMKMKSVISGCFTSKLSCM